MIELSFSKKIFAEKFFPYLYDYSHRWEFYMGSAGSGKSYFITQKILIRALSKQGRFAVCRRYGTTLRNSCFALFKDILKHWQLTPYCNIRETDMRITLPNGSEIVFIGLDDEEKLLSIVTMEAIFVEEAYEVPKDIIDQINLRLRGGKNQQILLAWNPISKNSYLYELWENPPENSVSIHSTYKDNPFLDEQYIKSLEELRDRNPSKARIYCDGEWGVDTDGLVFANWKIMGFDELELAGYCEHRAGMDFGYQDPSAIVDTEYDAANKRIYIVNEFYKRGQTLDQLVEAIEQMHLTKTKIQCDSAEPRTIDFFRKHYINAVPCIKGQNSVNARIMFLQNSEIIVHPRCENVIMELSNFSYIKDKKTGRFTDDTTHEYSHSLDALGYAYSDLYTKGRLRTMDKGILGL